MIGVVDYEAGNIRSVANALSAIQVPYVISAEQKLLACCRGIILPGVGAAPGALKSLVEGNIDSFLCKTTRPVLGICLGMQILYERSEEGDTSCLGIIPGKVMRLSSESVKIPHMGWNEVRFRGNSPLWTGISEGSFFYFAHSYVVSVGEQTIAETDCGMTFSAAIRYKNYYGVQFHPEKSGSDGLRILKNFEALCR